MWALTANEIKTLLPFLGRGRLLECRPKEFVGVGYDQGLLTFCQSASLGSEHERRCVGTGAAAGVLLQVGPHRRYHKFIPRLPTPPRSRGQRTLPSLFLSFSDKSNWKTSSSSIRVVFVLRQICRTKFSASGRGSVRCLCVTPK